MDDLVVEMEEDPQDYAKVEECMLDLLDGIRECGWTLKESQSLESMAR